MLSNWLSSTTARFLINDRGSFDMEERGHFVPSENGSFHKKIAAMILFGLFVIGFCTYVLIETENTKKSLAPFQNIGEIIHEVKSQLENESKNWSQNFMVKFDNLKFQLQQNLTNQGQKMAEIETSLKILSGKMNNGTQNEFEIMTKIIDEMKSQLKNECINWRQDSLNMQISFQNLSSHSEKVQNLTSLFIDNLMNIVQQLRNNTQKLESQLKENLINHERNITKIVEILSVKVNNYTQKMASSIQILENKVNTVRPKNCQQIQSRGSFLSSETTHLIYPINDTEGVQVKCDFTTKGGNWTIIQTRTSGPKDQFLKNWTDYENGFGDVGGNYWLGLLNIHALTQDKGQMLQVEMSDWNDTTAYAEYSSFEVGGPLTMYTLSIEGYSGTAGDSLSRHDKMKFSTPDKDNDGVGSEHCGKRDKGGWWFKDCTDSNLNGLYTSLNHSGSYTESMCWVHWKNSYYALKTAIMKIRGI